MIEIDPQILLVLNLLADDQDVIIYRKRLNAITGSVTATILLQQIVYWSKTSNFKPFFKFRAPCKHRWYKEGDSWTEELGFTVSEFDTAIKKIGTKVTTGDSKSEAYQGTSAQHMVIYWTDSSRITWYHLNANLLGKSIIPIYLENQDSRSTKKSGKADLSSSETPPETTPPQNFNEEEKTDSEAFTLWQSILLEMRGCTTKATFERIFAYTQGIQKDNGLLTVQCPNAEAKEWLDQRWAARIARAADGVEKKMQVRFVVKE